MSAARVLFTGARLALAAALIAAALPHAAAQGGAADLFAGFQSKSKDPVQVDAELLEVYEEGKQRVSVFSGNVVVKRGNTVMKAGTVKLYSPLEGAAPEAFTRIEASGSVYVSSGDQTMTGRTAIVDMTTKTITVAGGVVLSQGGNVITGSRLVINLATGRARVEQDAGQQIRGVFSPGGGAIGQ